jgi:hypothetical protein
MATGAIAMRPRFAAAAMCCLAAASCAPYDPARHYDAEAAEHPARIVDKRKFATRVQPAADRKTNMAFVYLPGATRTIMIALSFTPDSEAVIDLYEYTVETGDGQRTSVVNDYSAFEIGHCVTLFTASKPSYPRISPVGRCP